MHCSRLGVFSHMHCTNVIDLEDKFYNIIFNNAKFCFLHPNISEGVVNLESILLSNNFVHCKKSVHTLRQKSSSIL